MRRLYHTSLHGESISAFASKLNIVNSSFFNKKSMQEQNIFATMPACLIYASYYLALPGWITYICSSRTLSSAIKLNSREYKPTQIFHCNPLFYYQGYHQQSSLNTSFNSSEVYLYLFIWREQCISQPAR